MMIAFCCLLLYMPGTFEKNRIIGNGSIMFTDGSRYEGEMNSGWRHGNGVMSTDTYHYMGLYRRGKRHGRGLMTVSILIYTLQ